MAGIVYRPGRPKPGKNRPEIMEKIVSSARVEMDKRMQGYREQSLRLHPLVCGRCGREFIRDNLQELTVHHKDHNHENNPADGSNWENLCIYCHDQEHAKYLEHDARKDSPPSRTDTPLATHSPFAELQALLASREKKS